MFDQDRLRTQVQRFLPLLLVLWLVALVPATKKLLAFEWTAGATGPTPTRLALSTSSPASQDNDRAGLLIVAIHPLCSCTRATLKELQDAAPSWKLPYRTTFLLYKSKPNAATAISGFDWHHAAYIREAQQALHANVIEDIDGQQAARLGALTSGEVLFYSAPDIHGSRRLLFSGGVTAGRGMEGENGSSDSLTRSINAAGNQAEAHAPVYGCGLAALARSSPNLSPNISLNISPNSPGGHAK